MNHLWKPRKRKIICKPLSDLWTWVWYFTWAQGSLAVPIPYIERGILYSLIGLSEKKWYSWMSLLQLIGWLLVIGNLAVLLLLIVLNAQFADASVKYSFFTLMYITSLVCTMFALKDNSSVMLYPILISTVSFLVTMRSKFIENPHSAFWY